MALLPPDPVYLMRGNMGPIHCLLFHLSPSFEHIYAGSENGTVHIWDLQKNREFMQLNVCDQPCFSLQIFGDQCLVTQRKGGALNFWRAENSSWSIDKTVETNHYGFCRCQKSTDTTMFVPLNNSKVGLFSLQTYKTEIELDPQCFADIGPLGDIMAMKPCIDESKYVLITYDVGKILLWDIRLKKVLSSLEIGQCPLTIDFNSSLSSGLVGTPTKDLMVFSLSDHHQLSEKKIVTLKNPGTAIVAIRPDSKIFSAGCWDHRIRIFSWRTLRPLAALEQHKDTIHDIIYSSRVEAYNSKCLMAAAGKDGIISLWSLYN